MTTTSAPREVRSAHGGESAPHSSCLPPNEFSTRHVGPRADEIQAMLATLGYDSLDAFIDDVVPETIRLRRPLALAPGLDERAVLTTAQQLAERNQVFRSYLGMGYHGTFTPPVIQRNILENPGWYTAYTPYQAEIAQGRLEALLNFQTVVSDLTGLEIANASLLDEGTAAAEAMAMTLAIVKHEGTPVFLVDAACHRQTIAVVETRAEARGVKVIVEDPSAFAFGVRGEGAVVGCLLQYPATDGVIRDFRAVTEAAHAAGALVTVATDLLALALLTPPGEWGADVAVGNTQRFGVPMGYGGPHAAFYATRDAYKRHIPGRIIGLSKDSRGEPALRMALQTREQHIRRDKATSNVCTAQVLLAVMASMYAVYHGPEGIRRIAAQVHSRALLLAHALHRLGYTVEHRHFFDTLSVKVESWKQDRIIEAAAARKINLRRIGTHRVVVSLDETVTLADLGDLISCFALDGALPFMLDAAMVSDEAIPAALKRQSGYLSHPVFHRHRSETEMLRYLRGLEAKDLSLTAAMIPLGSCTMKLNATAEMMPVSYPGFGALHPFAPREQAQGYAEMFRQLELQLAEITGFARVSLQPNAGSQGEFAGLMVIRAYHHARGDHHRDICLIPTSAHGTNPASAVMAGMKVVVVGADEHGNIDVADLKAKAAQHAANLAALMVTYPSTHGVFESSIKEICEVIHAHGGQVYMDGANMNAQVGLCRPGDIGADVCHLNLHKTFCIPHGGGGPGMGPIGVAPQLAPYLPGHPVIDLGHAHPAGTISAGPWGSPSILPISWTYIQLMGSEGLTYATKVAILSANYIAKRLEGAFDLLYAAKNGLVAHECIIDMRPFKATAAIEVEDIAKRIIDFGFHPPTVSFPVAGTLMIEPTESEPKSELDRFVDALLAIREEIRQVEEGVASRDVNVLKGSPHTLSEVTANEWGRPYTREQAAFPVDALRQRKSWPTVGRIDSAYGDRNLVCTCPPVEDYV
ncbi:MAG TPA: aminomethyl-transferring glycine dehydrogenase [Gemmatimonadales bacterium]|nr:aminomethyl-transferring glycine dehydrogenase [Gemmatimonadales bacterium]